MQTTSNPSSWRATHPFLWNLVRLSGGLAAVVAAFLIALVLFTLPQSTTVTWLLAANTTQVTWYITRAAGLTAYLLLWLSTVWGLAVPSRILDGKLHGSYTFDFHQFISLLGIGFLALHMIVLLMDQYLPFSIFQLFIPFVADYRPLWTGLGTLSFYIIILVTITFYLRNRIGQKTFRAIHVFSLLGFAGAAIHGLMAGTDGVLPTVRLMYALTSLSVIFLTVYWVMGRVIKKKRT